MNNKQPINLLLAKGNKSHLSKAEIKARQETEIKTFNDKVEPPSYLPKKLKQEFIRLADELKRIDIISNLDNESLARFVVSEAQYQEVTKKLLSLNIESEDYGIMLLKQEKLFKMCRQSALDLCMNISSRCKLVIPKAEEKNINKFSKFM